MKHIFLIPFLLIAGCFSAQVAIGKSSISVIPNTTTINPSISLEFGNANKGMVLPWVTNTSSMTTAVNGTMVYSLNDKKVKVKYANEWKDLTVNTSGKTVDPVSGVDGAIIQTSATENESAKVAIGTVTSTPGILVLEDTNKAMVLPKVDSPHLNIVNPAPGMMVFDTRTKLLAVFNGTVWSYWRP